MTTVFKAIRLTDHVFWVGAVDWSIRDFHGYSTSRGTTYNAFLIKADKVTLIDTVKRPFADEMLSRIASVVNPEKIDIIVSNHSEMDHSGSLPYLLHRIKPEKVLASPMGVKCLDDHFRIGKKITPVKEGEKIDLGNLTLSFLATPMLHWPESMFSILEEEGVLFSQDAFGMHLATKNILAGENGDDLLHHEAMNYFANILLPYANRIGNLLKKAKPLLPRITMIAPDHGPVWEKGDRRIVDWYAHWIDQKPTDKAVIVYDTMWQSTAVMAAAVGEGLSGRGTDVRLMPIRSSHRSDIATELFDAGALIAGSPTLNNNIFPTMADILCYLKGLRPLNKVGAAFGSYGWSGEAVKQLNGFLEEMKIDVVGEGIKVKYVPDGNALAECISLGENVSARLKEKIGSS